MAIKKEHAAAISRNIGVTLTNTAKIFNGPPTIKREEQIACLQILALCHIAEAILANVEVEDSRILTQ